MPGSCMKKNEAQILKQGRLHLRQQRQYPLYDESLCSYITKKALVKKIIHSPAAQVGEQE